MNFRRNVLLGAARSRLPLEMVEKITVGTVFSSVKDDLFTSCAKIRSRRADNDLQSRLLYLKKIEGILASVSMPFNMIIEDDDLKKLFLCLHELQACFHESEFCLLFSEWLAAQIQRCDFNRVLFLIRCINSVSVTTEEGLNTFTLKHIGIPMIITFMQKCQSSDNATALLIFLEQSLRPPDGTITAEMIRDIGKAELDLLHRSFGFPKKEDTDTFAQYFQNLLDISRVVKAGSSVGDAIEAKVQHLIANATLSQLIECVLALRIRTHNSAYESLVSSEVFSPHSPSEFEKALCESSEASIVCKLVESEEVESISKWKDLNSILTLIAGMKNIPPRDITFILNRLRNPIEKVLKLGQISEITASFDKFTNCATRADDFSCIRSHVLAFTDRIYPKIVELKAENVEAVVLLAVAKGIVHLLSINSNLDTTVNAFCLYFVQNQKYLNPEITTCVAKMISYKKNRNSVLMQLMEAESVKSSIDSYAQSAGENLLAHVTEGRAEDIVSTIAALQEWYRPMNGDLLMRASKRIYKGSIRKVTLLEAIQCLHVLCEQRHVIHIQSIVHIANHLLKNIDDLKQSDIIEILFHLLNGKIKYDKLTDRLYLRSTELKLTSIESAQLLFFLGESDNRKISLVNKFMSIALENVSLFPMIRTTAANLGLQMNEIWSHLFASGASKLLCMNFDVPDGVLCGNLLHTVVNLPQSTLEKLMKDVMVPLVHRALEKTREKAGSFMITALLLKCRQILSEDDFYKIIPKAMYEEIVQFSAQKNQCPDSGSKTEDGSLQKFFHDDAQVAQYNRELFCKILHLESTQTLPFSSMRIRDASLIFIIFGGSITPSTVLLSPEKKPVASLAHMKLLLPTLIKNFHSISKQHRIDILLSLAYHKWRTCQILPSLLRSFVNVGNEECLTTVLIFQYATKMLGIVDNAFLTMTRALLTEEHAARRKGNSNLSQVDPFEKLVQSIR